VKPGDEEASEGDAAGCEAAVAGDADAAAGVATGDEAAEDDDDDDDDADEALELAVPIAAVEEEGDEVHPATPAPATTTAAPTAARRPGSLVEPNIANLISAAQAPQQHNVTESARAYVL
jgi:hypothetical protein